MPALVIFGLRLLQLAVYVEGAVIVVLLLVAVWLYCEAERLFGLYELARDACDDARATLKAIGRMSEIGRLTAERLDRAEGRWWS
ncbi:MAG: hypothetical protein ABSB69_07595 [Solirubrobacteraceae bacterium]